MATNFWWGREGDSRKIHWWRWEKLCACKVEGGLGFQDVLDFNQALLAKQGWGIFQSPSSLTSRVLKDNYFISGILP